MSNKSKVYRNGRYKNKRIYKMELKGWLEQFRKNMEKLVLKIKLMLIKKKNQNKIKTYSKLKNKKNRLMQFQISNQLYSIHKNSSISLY